MGRRELLIVVAFVAIGAIAYHFTAPAARPGQGLTLSRLMGGAKRSVTPDNTQATITQRGVIAISPSVTDVQIEHINQTVQIVGEARADIEYELTVQSDGPDAAGARARAGRVAVKRDDLGAILALDVVYPPEGQQLAKIRLRVPSRINVRVDGTTGVRVSGVAGVRVEGVVGDVNVESVTGGVRGTHRNGNLTITGAAAATLTLVSSTATFERIAGGLTLTTRASHCLVTASAGPVEIDETNTDVSIDGQAGSIHVTGTGGSVTIDDPRAEATVDVRHSEVEATLATAVPLMLVTTDESLRLILRGPVSANVDAVAADGGRIQATDFALQPAVAGDEQRLEHGFGAGGPAAPRVVLRNQRADIVIRKAK